jgi:hypothetical protein
MKGHKFILSMVLVMLISSFMISCSGGSGSDKKISGESIDDPGASVAALAFKDAYPIEIQMQDPTGEFVAVHDGQYVEPGKKRFAVTVQGDKSDIDKVLLSDGGVYQVEAIKQGDSYQADFTFNNDRLYTTVLVQAIHKNQRASKEKIVFKTFNDASGEKMITNGIGILASNDILYGNRELLASELDKFVGEAFNYFKTQNSGIVSSLSYGDNNPNTIDIEIVDFKSVHNAAYSSAVIHLDFIIHNVNLAALNIKGQDLITTKNNDLNVDMFIAIEDQGNGSKRGLVFDFLGSPSLSFKKDFILRSVVEQKIASSLFVIELAPLVTDLDKLFETLGNLLPLSINVNDSTVDIVSLFDKQNMDLSKYMFIDLYGIPENTSQSEIALGAGLYITQDKIAKTSTSQDKPVNSPDLNGIIIDLCQVMVDKAFESIKQQYKGLVSTLSYGDNNPQTNDFIINSVSIQDTSYPETKMIQTNFTIKDVDFSAVSLFGFSLINTQNNDLTIDATFLLSTSKDTGGVVLILDIQQVAKVAFRDYFVGKLIIEGLAKNTIENMDNSNAGIDNIISALSFDIDLSGSGSPGFEFPDVLETRSPYEWDLKLPEGDNLSLVISQDNINWVLAHLFTRAFEWDIYEMLGPILGSNFEGFNNDSSDKQETIMRFSVPPVFDLRASQIRIQADDVFLEYRLNGEPQWEASIDLDFILDARVVNNELAFFISPHTEKCHFHIMKDNLGNLGIFDHSNLVNDIIGQLPILLGNSPGGPIFTISLRTFEPLLVLNSLENPINISAGDGYLYIDMNALDVDLSLLKEVLAAPL